MKLLIKITKFLVVILILIAAFIFLAPYLLKLMEPAELTPKPVKVPEEVKKPVDPVSAPASEPTSVEKTKLNAKNVRGADSNPLSTTPESQNASTMPASETSNSKTEEPATTESGKTEPTVELLEPIDFLKKDAEGLTELHVFVKTEPQSEEEMAEKTKALQNLLKQGADIEVLSEAGYTPLMYAISLGNRKMCLILICCGAKVNFPDKSFDISPLIFAVRLKNYWITRLLYEEGAANILAVNREGFGALQEAAKVGFDDGLKSMLHYLKEIKMKDCNNIQIASTGATLLHIAAQNNQLDIVRLLVLILKADKGIVDAQGKLPFDYAQDKLDQLNALPEQNSEALDSAQQILSLLGTDDENFQQAHTKYKEERKKRSYAFRNRKMVAADQRKKDEKIDEMKILGYL